MKVIQQERKKILVGNPISTNIRLRPIYNSSRRTRLNSLANFSFGLYFQELREFCDLLNSSFFKNIGFNKNSVMRFLK